MNEASAACRANALGARSVFSLPGLQVRRVGFCQALDFAVRLATVVAVIRSQSLELTGYQIISKPIIILHKVSVRPAILEAPLPASQFAVAPPRHWHRAIQMP